MKEREVTLGPLLNNVRKILSTLSIFCCLLRDEELIPHQENKKISPEFNVIVGLCVFFKGQNSFLSA